MLGWPIGHEELGTAILGLDAGMPRLGAEDRGIDVEAAARHHQPVDHAQVGIGLLDLMGKQHGNPAGSHDCRTVVLTQRIPRQHRIAARRLRIESEADDRLCHCEFSPMPGTLGVVPGHRNSAAATVGAGSVVCQVPSTSIVQSA